MDKLSDDVPGERPIILHYHLFKNAGTSLDSAFKEAFPDGGWAEAEFDGPPHVSRAATAKWIEANPQVSCFSSHTALLPAPRVAGARVFPVLFLRHPIDRIASAYAFESRQGAATFGSTLARHTSLAGYVETRLSLPNDYQCRNFHAWRLAETIPSAGDGTGEQTLRERALEALDMLPFVGLVEDFDRSLRCLQEALRAHGFPDLELYSRKRNVSRAGGHSLEDKLEDVRREIGEELHERLAAANAVDLEVHERLRSRFADRARQAA